MILLNPIYTITILLLLTIIETTIKPQSSKLLQHTKSLNYIYLLQTKYPTRKVIEISIQILQRTQQLHTTINQHTSFIDKIYNLTNKYHLNYYHSQNNTFLPLRQVYQTQNESQRVNQSINNTIQVQLIDIDNNKYQFYHSLTLRLRQPQSFLPFMTDLSILQQQHHFEMTLAYQDEIIDTSAINETYMKDYITKQSEKRCQKYFKMSLNHIISYQNIESYLLKKQQQQTTNPQKSNSNKNKDPKNQKSQYKPSQQQLNKINSNNNNQSQIQIKVNNRQTQKQYITYSYYDALQQIQQQKINQLVQRQNNHIFRVQIVCNNEKYKSIKRDQQIKRVINNITSSNNRQEQTDSQTNRQNKKAVEENIVIKGDKRNNVKEIETNRSQLIVIKQQKKSKQKIQKANKIDVNAINDKLKAMKSQSEAQQKVELKQKKGQEKQMKGQLKQKKEKQKQKLGEQKQKKVQQKQKKGQQRQKTKTSNKRPKMDKKIQTNEL